MKTKSTKTFREMAVVLEKYAELFKGLPTTAEINMSQGTKPTRRFPGCVGAYIALFNDVDRAKVSRNSFWQTGAEIFAREMGFKNKYSLGQFLAYHPKIWGNIWGKNCTVYMFYDENAYNEGEEEYGYGTLTPTAVSTKFREVAKRLVKASRKK